MGSRTSKEKALTCIPAALMASVVYLSEGGEGKLRHLYSAK